MFEGRSRRVGGLGRGVAQGAVLVWALAGCGVLAGLGQAPEQACDGGAQCPAGSLCVDGICRAQARSDGAAAEVGAGERAGVDQSSTDGVTLEAGAGDRELAEAGADAAWSEAGEADGPSADAVAPDSSSADGSGVDAVVADSSPADAELVESGAGDAGESDASASDAVLSDASGSDASGADAEAADAAGSCVNRSDGTPCGAPVCTSWGGCIFGDDPVCDESGERRRSCSPRICLGELCVAGAPGWEYGSCGRSTEGNVCDAPICSSCGACQWDPSNPDCAQTGVGSQTCTPRVCVSGVCSLGVNFEQNCTCQRVTNDDPCGTTSCGSCSSCDWGLFEPVCAETGQGLRTCTPQICRYGACVDGEPYGDLCSCQRETDDLPCGTSCNACSGCIWSSLCDNSGPGSQLCTNKVCSNGACSGSSGSYAQSCDCERNTEGQSCGFSGAGCPLNTFHELCCHLQQCTDVCSTCQ